ncbi:MAG TPA: DNA polymerase III subunit gamma/tau [Bacteroidales bacterium]|nr:DNA polymerase III subunit gamma/tau [Bacteroidales bacterium]
MENFIVSARKYRPDNFESVVGQRSITSTLKNAIRSNHLAQAYLFCGPRGVGKTTCARIFAKTINCRNLTQTMEACNECDSCKAFNEGRSYNIHELDAASNNSVDDMRNLTEQVRIPPQVGKYSVYIIDEVHMLSAAAFNAFLKTLEEPPKHAIFILATTEKHKIIPTILSRCQIFDFNRIRVEDTVEYLEYISKQEGVDYELDAFNVVAQKADGAMRDALSIYDQIVSFSGNAITYKAVIENLNVLDYEYYFRLTDAFLDQNFSQSLLIFDEILEKGFDAHNFVTALSKHFRDLLVSKDKVTLDLMEAGAGIKEKYISQSAKCSPAFLMEALEVTRDCDVSFKAARNQRLHVELMLIKLAGLLSDEKKKDNHTESEPVKKNSTPEINSGPQVKPTEKKKVTETPVATRVEKSAVSSRLRSSTISIKGALKDPMGMTAVKNVTENSGGTVEAEPEQVSITATGRTGTFTQEEVLAAIASYSDSIKQNNPRMYSTLSNQKPVFESEYRLVYEMNNTVQLDTFSREIKNQLLAFLKNSLGNDQIEIDAILSEGSEGEDNNKLYTPEDKFKYMSEKNPVLNKLKQHFNLDFD